VGKYSGDPTYSPSTSAPFPWTVVDTLPLGVRASVGSYQECVSVSYAHTPYVVSGASIALYFGTSTTPDPNYSYTETTPGSGQYCPPVSVGSIPDGTTVKLVASKGSQTATGFIQLPYAPQSLVFTSAKGVAATNSPVGSQWWYLGGGTQTATFSWSLAANQVAGASYSWQLYYYWDLAPGSFPVPTTATSSQVMVFPIISGGVYAGGSVKLSAYTYGTFASDAWAGSSISSNYRTSGDYLLVVQP
jgi:hypothetical protein